MNSVNPMNPMNPMNPVNSVNPVNLVNPVNREKNTRNVTYRHCHWKDYRTLYRAFKTLQKKSEVTRILGDIPYTNPFYTDDFGILWYHTSNSLPSSDLKVLVQFLNGKYALVIAKYDTLTGFDIYDIQIFVSKIYANIIRAMTIADYELYISETINIRVSNY